MTKFLKTLITIGISCLFISSVVYSATYIMPNRGGTGVNSSNWTGVLNVTNGTWGTTSPSGDLNAIWSTSSTAIYPTDLGLNIGIGTSSPQELLTIYNATSSDSRDLFRISSTTQDALVVDASGNVGIGTSSPSDTLDVVGTLQVQNLTDSINAYQFFDADGGKAVLNIDTTNERVGIGTLTGPSYTLDVIGEGRFGNSAKVTIGDVLAGTSYSGIWLNQASPSVSNYAFLSTTAATILNAPSGDSFAFRIGNSNKMQLRSSGGFGFGDSYYANDPGADNFIIEGTLGIGTTGADRKLDILDATNPQLRLTHTDGSVYTDLQTTASGHLSISGSGGNVGIATTTPDAKLTVVGNISGTGTLDIDATSTLATTTATQLTANEICLGGVCNTSWAGGGSGDSWTTSSSKIYPTELTDTVLIGANATSTAEGQIFEVIGFSLFDNFRGITATTTNLTVTSTFHGNIIVADATSTFAGRVGIGTTTPEMTLDVLGNVKATSYYGDGSTLTGTNITAGDHLTITSTDIDLDTEVITRSSSINLGEWDAVNAEAVQKDAETDLTITQIICYSKNTTTTISMDLRATSTPHTAGTKIFNPEMACPPYQSYSTTTFADATIEGGGIMNLEIAGLSAQVSSSTVIILKYTIDDN